MPAEKGWGKFLGVKKLELLNLEFSNVPNFSEFGDLGNLINLNDTRDP
jgi:hypothetical protein